MRSFVNIGCLMITALIVITFSYLTSLGPTPTDGTGHPLEGAPLPITVNQPSSILIIVTAFIIGLIGSSVPDDHPIKKMFDKQGCLGWLMAQLFVFLIVAAIIFFTASGSFIRI